MLLHLLTGKKEASHSGVASVNVHVLGYKSANVISVRCVTGARATIRFFGCYVHILAGLINKPEAIVLAILGNSPGRRSLLRFLVSADEGF